MFRYPKGGKGSKWTTTELKAVRADWQKDILSDGDGLQGDVRVTPSGGVSVRFRYAFRWAGKSTWHQCGTWPTVAIAEARERRNAARILVGRGINPNDQKKVDRIEAQARLTATIAEAARLEAENLSFRALFDAWLSDGVARQDGNAELRRTFEKDVLPSIGETPVRLVDDAKWLEVLRAVGRGRGAGRTAQRMLTEVRQLYRWAIKRKPWRALLPDGNPAELVEPEQVALDTYGDGVRERDLSPTEIRELFGVFGDMRSRYNALPDGKKYSGVRPMKRENELALWIALGTTCRIGELLKARWEKVDLKKGEWFVPAADTKTKVNWDVFLSDFALRQFKELHTLTGNTPWCFPALRVGRERDGAHAAVNHVGEKTVTKQVGDRQIRFMKRAAPLDRRKNDDSLVLAEGANGEWGAHDLRRTGATMMQALDVPTEHINRCQNHKMPGPKAQKHYLHHEFAREKRAAWQRLGDHLDAILNAASDADAEELLEPVRMAA